MKERWVQIFTAYTVLISDMFKVIPGLFIGNKDAAASESLLIENHISRIVSLGCSVDPVAGVLYQSYPDVLDTPDTIMFDTWTKTDDFITVSIKEGMNVLVHCVYGQSRSAATVVAYLLSVGWSLSEALTTTKRCNPTTSINPGFLSQLLFRSVCPHAEHSCELELISLTRLSQQALSPLNNSSSRSTARESNTNLIHSGGNVLLCKQCRQELATHSRVINQSLAVSTFVKEHADGFWKDYHPPRPKSLGPMVRAPIKGAWVLCPVEWMLVQAGRLSPRTPTATDSDATLSKRKSAGAAPSMIDTTVDIDREVGVTVVAETILCCPGCGTEVGAFKAKQLDLIGPYCPCDLYTLSEAAVRLKKHRQPLN